MNEALTSAWRVSRPAALPLAILVATTLAAWLLPPLPKSLEGLRIAGPYAVLILATALTWWFNRGRAFVLAASLLIAFAAVQLFQHAPVYTAAGIVVPLNVLLAMLRTERGARYRAAYGWLALLGVEALLLAAIGLTGGAPFWSNVIDNWLLRSSPTAFVGRVMFAAAFGAALWRAWPDHTPLQVGIAGALMAFFIAAASASPGAPVTGVLAAFMSAAGAILVAGLLQESHRLAFRDELTGLPGRRALEERLRSLRERYAVAMVDVDHFKQFNDTHGHDVGDQVLKLVGKRLAQIGGGGIAYRYGGEEFSVLFPDLGLAEAQGHLESIRRSIEDYRMAIRGEDRPRRMEEGERQRGGRAPPKTLSVTVSVGVAEPGGAARTPAQVIRAADEALYRAKQAGRNRLSR